MVKDGLLLKKIHKIMLPFQVSGEKTTPPSPLRPSKILVNPPCPFPKNLRSPPQKKILFCFLFWYTLIGFFKS